MWYHHYSLLTFLGKSLDLISQSEDVPFTYDDGNTAGFVAAAITVFSRLISACIDSDRGPPSSLAKETAKSILKEASDSLNEKEDIVSLIFDIFELELQNLRHRSAGERNLEILIACLQFFHSTTSLLPSRMWPLLARSALLDAEGRGGFMVSIVTSIEASSGDYTFFKCCAELYLALIDEAVALPTSHVGLGSKPRSSAKQDESQATPLHVVSKVLLAMTQSLVGLLDSATDFRFLLRQQQAEVNTCICSAFGKIIKFTYFVDDTSPLSKKLTSALSLAAPCIIEALRAEPLIGSLANPMIRILASGCQLPDPAFDVASYEAHIKEVEACLSLCLYAVKAGRSLGEPLLGFETHLVNALPLFPRLVAEHEQFLTPTVKLVACLLSKTSPSTLSSQSPSLLGQLGSDSSQSFLSLLGRHDRVGDESEACLATWELLTTLVSNGQQWFAVFILTGSSPKDSMNVKDRNRSDSDVLDAGGKSFLDLALQLLHRIEQLEPRLSSALLQFVARAQENWSWATSSIRNQSGFLPSLYNYVSKIDLKANNHQLRCYEFQNAAVIAEILTVHFHHMRSIGDSSFLKKAIPSIIWYTEHATDVSAYNNSLHSRLKQNLELKCPGCQLSNFKKTTAAPTELGQDYYYDVDIARTILGYDMTWFGDRDSGFEHEVRRANVNLSTVEAELRLLRSWRTLAIEHCALFLQDPELRKPIISAASKCLASNTSPFPQEAIFDKVFQIRADLALSLLQRLNAAKCEDSEAKALLDRTWDAVLSRGTNFDVALANNDLQYWWTLVEILFLALQFHCFSDSEKSATKALPLKSTTLSIVLDVLTVVVAQSFRGLTSVLHDEQAAPETVTPKEFGLILGILQTCLRIPSVPRISAEIAEHVISTNVAKSAILLYSWSHVLTPNGGPNSEPDPIYGEISLLFLVSLTTIPLLAEEQATSSILSQLSATQVTQLLSGRTRGVSPLDSTSVLSRRLYSIWSTGILQLCLNLLTHVGRAFAAEVAAFLSQFPAQLQDATLSFASSAAPPSASNPASGAFSLSMANETASIALIAFILDAYRAAGPSAGVDALEIPELPHWDEKGRKELREDLEYLLERRATLRRRIVPTSPREDEMLRAKPTHGDQGYENKLEQAVVEELQGIITCLRGREDL